MMNEALQSSYNNMLALSDEDLSKFGFNKKLPTKDLIEYMRYVADKSKKDGD